jgi:biotin carboxyl carrier protein
MKLTVTLPDGEHVVSFDEAYGQRSLMVDGESYDLSLLRVEAGRIRFTVNGRPVDALITNDAAEMTVDAGAGPVSLQVEETRFAEVRKISGVSDKKRAAADLKAPMPGLVTRIMVAEGDTVQSGTPLLVMEAMKMENELRAQGDGRVTRIHVTSGSAVEQGAILIAIEAVPEAVTPVP